MEKYKGLLAYLSCLIWVIFSLRRFNGVDNMGKIGLAERFLLLPAILTFYLYLAIEMLVKKTFKDN